MRDKKESLNGLTILLLVRIDSDSRYSNLITTLKFLTFHFDVQIILLETDSCPKCASLEASYSISYHFIEDSNAVMHRTKYNNELIKMASTSYVALYDIDIVIDPAQLKSALAQLHQGADLVYPYDGRFIEVDQVYKKEFVKALDIRFLNENVSRFKILFYSSFGGLCCFNKEKYLTLGGENESLFGWCPDDIERYRRMKINDFKISRIAGPLFHLWHERNMNSKPANDLTMVKNQIEYLKSCNN